MPRAEHARTDRRLRGAGALRRGRRRVPRPRAGARSCARTATATELVSVPFKWYPKDEILPHAAAWRLLDLSESNGRPIDLVDRHEVPVVLRAAPAQGGVADPPVPRRLRAVRHAVSATSPTSEQDVGLREQLMRARHADARRVPRASSATRRTPRTGSRSYNGLDGRAAVSSSAARRPPRGRAVRRLRAVGRAHRERQARRPGRPRDGARGRAGCGWSSPATARSARNTERLAAELGVADRVTFLGAVRRRDAAAAVRGRARGRLRALRRGLRLRDARGVPRAASPVITATRQRRPARVRRGRRERRASCRADARGASPTAINALRAPTAAGARRTATPATSGRGTITWDGVIERIIGAAVGEP